MADALDNSRRELITRSEFQNFREDVHDKLSRIDSNIQDWMKEARGYYQSQMEVYERHANDDKDTFTRFERILDTLVEDYDNRKLKQQHSDDERREIKVNLISRLAELAAAGIIGALGGGIIIRFFWH